MCYERSRYSILHLLYLFSNIDCCCRNNLVFPFVHSQLCTDEISYQVFLLLMCLDKHIISIDILSVLPNMNLFLKVFPIFLVKLFFVQTLSVILIFFKTSSIIRLREWTVFNNFLRCLKFKFFVYLQERVKWTEQLKW